MGQPKQNETKRNLQYFEDMLTANIYIRVRACVYLCYKMCKLALKSFQGKC